MDKVDYEWATTTDPDTINDLMGYLQMASMATPKEVGMMYIDRLTNRFVGVVGNDNMGYVYNDGIWSSRIKLKSVLPTSVKSFVEIYEHLQAEDPEKYDMITCFGCDPMPHMPEGFLRHFVKNHSFEVIERLLTELQNIDGEAAVWIDSDQWHVIKRDSKSVTVKRHENGEWIDVEKQLRFGISSSSLIDAYINLKHFPDYETELYNRMIRVIGKKELDDLVSLHDEVSKSKPKGDYPLQISSAGYYTCEGMIYKDGEWVDTDELDEISSFMNAYELFDVYLKYRDEA